MKDFKIGDKVRRINCNWKAVKVGDIVTIKYIDKRLFDIRVKEHPSLNMMMGNFEKAGCPNSGIIIKE